MHERNIRLPEDLIGDDGLIAALAATDLRGDAYWDRERVEPCEAEGFYCEPAELLNPVTMRIQYRRMINYSVRRYQNQLISRVMQNAGPTGLPVRHAQIYSAPLTSFTIRTSPALPWFDYQALCRNRRAEEFTWRATPLPP